MQTSSSKSIVAWDLLVFGNHYFLALGDTLSFAEQYDHLASVSAVVAYKRFVSTTTVQFFHWMVATYYTTYKSVAKLFFADDIQKLLEREQKASMRGLSHTSVLPKSFPFTLSPTGQTLLVFPDLRTMFARIAPEFREHPNVVCLLSTQTQHQKDLAWWYIKTGSVSTILATYAEVFQDFSDLKKIIFVDPHKRYYANQQDPRYKVAEVLKYLQQISHAEMETVGV